MLLLTPPIKTYHPMAFTVWYSTHPIQTHPIQTHPTNTVHIQTRPINPPHCFPLVKMKVTQLHLPLPLLIMTLPSQINRPSQIPPSQINRPSQIPPSQISPPWSMTRMYSTPRSPSQITQSNPLQSNLPQSNPFLGLPHPFVHLPLLLPRHRH